jgi:hypothetical protein
MVDLVGIEPTTSSMPWKRAPSCATGPLMQTVKIRAGETVFILAHLGGIVNAQSAHNSGSQSGNNNASSRFGCADGEC